MTDIAEMIIDSRENLEILILSLQFVCLATFLLAMLGRERAMRLLVIISVAYVAVVLQNLKKDDYQALRVFFGKQATHTESTTTTTAKTPLTDMSIIWRMASFFLPNSTPILATAPPPTPSPAKTFFEWIKF